VGPDRVRHLAAWGRPRSQRTPLDRQIGLQHLVAGGAQELGGDDTPAAAEERDLGRLDPRAEPVGVPEPGGRGEVPSQEAQGGTDDHGAPQPEQRGDQELLQGWEDHRYEGDVRRLRQQAEPAAPVRRSKLTILG
jgi:hypothetical protein